MLPKALTLAVCLGIAAVPAAAQDNSPPNPNAVGALNAGLVMPGMAAALALLILSEMGGTTVENPGTGGKPVAPGSF